MAKKTAKTALSLMQLVETKKSGWAPAGVQAQQDRCLIVAQFDEVRQEALKAVVVVAVGAVVVVSHAVVAGVLGALEVLVPLQKTQSKPILWQVPRFVLLRHCCQGLGAPATTVPYQWAATAHPERADGAPRVQAQLSILRESKLPKQL